VSHQDFIRFAKISAYSHNDEFVVSLFLHLGKYPGICFAEDTFCATIPNSHFVNAFSCLLSIKHSCMIGFERCYTDRAYVTVHCAGKNDMSYKEYVFQ
jgi:hypothetical protein